MMGSYYEINVAKRSTNDRVSPYQHFFATAPRSCQSLTELRRVAAEIIARFPEPDYLITVTHEQHFGNRITREAIGL